MNSLVFELANVSAKECTLLERVKCLLSAIAVLQVNASFDTLFISSHKCSLGRTSCSFSCIYYSMHICLYLCIKVLVNQVKECSLRTQILQRR